jgi:hypothetical protein
MVSGMETGPAKGLLPGLIEKIQNSERSPCNGGKQSKHIVLKDPVHEAPNVDRFERV